MQSPYKYDPTNPRVVTNVQNNTAKVYAGSFAIYAISLYLYNRKFFRIDGNGVAAAAFAGFGIPASYIYAKFLLDTPENEAGLENNRREGR